MLENISKNYCPPEIGACMRKSKKGGKNGASTSAHTTPLDAIPNNLFDVLPFRDFDISDKQEDKPYVVLKYLPDGIYHQIRRACNKAGINLVTKPGNKLQSMLCGRNKTRHAPKRMPGVYRVTCPCSPDAQYIGQTIRPIETRGKEHERAATKGDWSHSGICQHKETCHEQVNWEPEVIATMTNKNKRKLTYDLKVREALEIRRHNCGPGKGLNEDMGAYVKTTMWNPVFHKMRNDEGGGRGAHP